MNLNGHISPLASLTGKHMKDIGDPQAFSKAYLQKIFQMYLPGENQLAMASMFWKLCVKTCPDLPVLGWSGTGCYLRPRVSFPITLTPPNSMARPASSAFKPFTFCQILNCWLDWFIGSILESVWQSCVSSANGLEWKYLWRMVSFNQHDPL